MKFICHCIAIALCFSMWSASALADAYAYIPNSSQGTVTVLDLTYNTEVDTINLPDGSQPYAAAVSPDGNYVYVVNNYGEGTNGSVTIISTNDFLYNRDDDDYIVATIGVGQDPRGVAVDPNSEYVYVTNYGGNSLSVLQKTDEGHQYDGTIAVGANPWGLVVDPNAEHVYVANFGDNSVAMVSNGSDVDYLDDIGTNPLDIVHDSNRNRLYVTCAGSNTVAVISVQYPDEDDDEVQLSLQDEITVGNAPWGIAQAPFNKEIYVSHDGSGAVWIIDADDYENIVTLDIAKGLRGITSAVNGDTMYVAGGNENDAVYLIDIENQALAQTLDSATYGFGVPIAMGRFIGGYPPQAPADLASSDVGKDSITLEWEYDSFNSILGFKIQRRHNDDNDNEFVTVGIVASGVKEYEDTGLSEDTTYVYRVCSYNESGDSATSDSLYVTTDKDESSLSCFISELNCPETLATPSAAALLFALGFAVSLTLILVLRSRRRRPE